LENNNKPNTILVSLAGNSNVRLTKES
jgi:hypothetical protein